MKIKTICKFYDDDCGAEYDNLEYEVQQWCEGIAEECGFDGCDDIDSLLDWLNG